jgi:transposase
MNQEDEMTTAVTRTEESSRSSVVLHLALELSEKKWILAFTTGLGQKPRQVTIPASDLIRLAREVEAAKRRFRLAGDVGVVSCYEAGLEGFWLHRALEQMGLENVVVDSASIDVKRRRRRAKTDRLDGAALVKKLVQFVAGDRKVWSVVRVPPPEAEDLRHNARELERLLSERTAAYNAIRGLLKTQGVRLKSLTRFGQMLQELRQWNGAELGNELKARLSRLWERVELLQKQIREVEERRGQLLAGESLAAAKARQLQELKAIGPTGSWGLATELFGWRKFSNRREVGGLVGLGGTPFQSGTVAHDQGISKQGRPQLRGLLVEMAWLWVRYQKESPITQWFEEKYADGGKRLRRIGIVAVARKLLVQLWKFLETGALPEGALTKA